jgi:NADH-quinone oxidoreductase subunit D
MQEMYQSMSIVEQALLKLPKGPIHVDYSGKPIPPSMMVDMAKLGKTEGLIKKFVDLEPTLEGGGKDRVKAISADNHRITLPSKEDTYSNIEGLMNHFKLIMFGHGIQPPLGEAYVAVEGANGELGFYVVSDGTDRAYKVHVRAPCFHIMSALSHLIQNSMVADIVPTFGSVNMIGGELDR